MRWPTLWFKKPVETEVKQTWDEVLPGLGLVKVVAKVDCLGAMCPRPQLLVMKILDALREGDVIEIVTDNAAAAESFPAIALTLDSAHLVTLHDPGAWRIYLRKGF